MQEPSSTPTATVNVAETVATTPGQTSNRAALLIVFLVVFIDLLGFGIVLPLLPVIGNEYVGQLVPGGKDSALAGAIVGMLMASFSIMQFLGAPIWGRISDRIGRRPVLLIGLAGSVVFYSLLGIACMPSMSQNAALPLVLLFVARIGAGLAGATIATAQAVIADSTPPDKRKHGMALIGAAFGIGFAFGPLLGALDMTLFSGHFESIGFSAAVISLIALLLGWRILPETRRFEESPSSTRKLINLSAIQMALQSSATGPVVLVFFLATLGFTAFEMTLALFFKDILHFPEDQSYLFFAYIGFVLLLTQGLIYRRLAKRVSEPTFMLFGILFMALGLLELAVVTMTANGEYLSYGATLTLVLAGLACAVFGFAFLTPSAQALISRRTDANKQGEILGVNQSAAALARIIGPPVSITLLKLNPLLPFVFAASLLIMMLPLMPRIKKG